MWAMFYKQVSFCFLTAILNKKLVWHAQQSNSVIHVSILFSNSFPFRLLYNIEQSSLCYTVGPCWLSILFSFFKSLFDVDHFLSLCWICYNIASFMFWFFGFEACGILASWPDQGSNLHPLHWQCRVLTTGLPGKCWLFILNIAVCTHQSQTR